MGTLRVRIFPKFSGDAQAVSGQWNFLPKHDVVQIPVRPALKDFSSLPPYVQEVVQPYVSDANNRPALNQLGDERMGLIEEASDLYHEVLVLAAWQEGRFPVRALQKTQDLLRHHSNPLTDPKQVMQQVSSWLSDSNVASVADLAGADPALVRRLLVLDCIRLATLQMEGRFKRVAATTMRQISREFKELAERCPPATRLYLDNIRRHLEKVTRIERVPVESLQELLLSSSTQARAILPVIRANLTQLMGQAIHPDLSMDTLLQYHNEKHALRQGLRLSRLHDPTMDYDRRKKILKPWEALIEASFLASYSH